MSSPCIGQHEHISVYTLMRMVILQRDQVRKKGELLVAPDDIREVICTCHISPAIVSLRSQETHSIDKAGHFHPSLLLGFSNSVISFPETHRKSQATSA